MTLQQSKISIEVKTHGTYSTNLAKVRFKISPFEPRKARFPLKPSFSQKPRSSQKLDFSKKKHRKLQRKIFSSNFECNTRNEGNNPSKNIRHLGDFEFSDQFWDFRFGSDRPNRTSSDILIDPNPVAGF